MNYRETLQIIDPVIVSLSGGRTSAFMLKQLIDQGFRVVPVFMNTGLEHDKTYLFLENIMKHWSVDIICLESVVQHGKKKSSSYKVVEFKRLHKGNSIALEVFKKYGAFGQGFLHCTREFKLNPFLKWKKDNYPHAKTAIGIRADEFDRMVDSASKNQIIYPLVKWGVTKQIVNEWFDLQSFDLDIPEHLGNCVGCWKKSNNKLIKAVNDMPEAFELLKPVQQEDRKMFRGNRTVEQLIVDAKEKKLEESEVGSGCEESCEVFSSDLIESEEI